MRPCASWCRGLQPQNTTGLTARLSWAAASPRPFPLFNDPLSVRGKMKAGYTTRQMCISLVGVHLGQWLLADTNAQQPETRAQCPAPGVSGCPSSSCPSPASCWAAGRQSGCVLSGLQSSAQTAVHVTHAGSHQMHRSYGHLCGVGLPTAPLLACRWATRGSEPL